MCVRDIDRLFLRYFDWIFGTGEEVLSGEKLVSYPFVARNNKLYFKTKTVPTEYSVFHFYCLPLLYKHSLYKFYFPLLYI